ncbi:MAG: hypothetical protein ACRYF0_02260 [Janthinobacterium lividum]
MPIETILLDEPWVLVWADSSVPCIVVQLRAFANREQFKNLMNVGLAHYKAHSQPTHRWGWVADTRHMSAIPHEVQQWLADDWNKQAHQAGLREMSIVSSANVLAQLATQHYAQKTVEQTSKYTLEPVYYASLAEAKKGAAQRCTALNTKR